MKKEQANIKISLRANISAEANQIIEGIKSQRLVDGIKLSKEETLEYILTNLIKIK